MSAHAKSNTAPQENVVSNELDEIMFQLFNSLANGILANTQEAAMFILDVSRKFLDKKAHRALKDFHDMYFGEGLKKLSRQINDEVDDMITSLMEAQANNKELEVTENEDAKRDRLSLSALQKKLEAIISLDEGIREKLLPILSSMQFEDLIRHRITHIQMALELVHSQLAKSGKVDVKLTGEKVATFMTSAEETKLYYKQVLHKEPPKDLVTDKQINLVDIIWDKK